MTVQATVTRCRTWLATHLDPSFSMLLALPLNIPLILYANTLVQSQNCLSLTSYCKTCIRVCNVSTWRNTAAGVSPVELPTVGFPYRDNDLFAHLCGLGSP